ncbi:asparaginyl peptidase, putative [Ixodes scapularis]|uniref:Asparaginyl peptidase, putative n=1 Tax=Ixodes scapularis TaxID=6945 RepID=B7PB91_IXOSC|nr:asparaginyl peptidase, putative [Ixodes scapularis]|eukprot:XP_002407769.1 asparaginyl peptidase, putative [Ixodes scapularis]
MYDDIAYNPRNPTPGIVVNYLNGRDHYAGTIKDYIGASVTASNFLGVLQGRRELIEGGSGKVCGSGPKDHTFVYLDSLETRRLVSFSDDALHAKDLTEAIKKLLEERKYAKMVFYLYASFSGSMFDGRLLYNISVFSTTAADPYEEACTSE